MNEKPILFKGDMVRAILEGRKTKTRRIIPESLMQCLSPEDEPEKFVEWCRYGQVGDRLWVRETWRIVGWTEDGDWCIEYKDGSEHWFDSVQDIDEDTSIRYWEQCTDDCIKAQISEDENGDFRFDDQHPCPTRWRPSIFMPRWASRITLEIVTVRVERLQEITVTDVLAEGIKQTEPDSFYLAPLDGVPDFPWTQAIPAFASLWNSINEKRGYGWDTNPWVWVIEFKKIDQQRGDNHVSPVS